MLVTGATLAEAPWAGETLIAFIVAFIGSVAMWWIYFDTGAERGSHGIASSDDPGRLARLAYTYMHIVIVAGIVVGAVSDELLLAHPNGHVEAPGIAAMLGGPALFVLGNFLFKWVIAGRVPLSHLVGVGLLAALIPVAPGLTPLALASAATLVLVLVAAWECVSLHRGLTSVTE